MTLQRMPDEDAGWQTMAILGVPVAVLDGREASDLLLGRVRDDRFTRVGFLNAHTANVACSDPGLARTLCDFLVLADGAGVDIAAKLLYGRAFPANLNGTDFVPALLQAAEPLRVALLGASRRNVEAAAVELRRLAPQHVIEAVADGFFDPRDEPQILARLADFRPDILLVAMGVPRQEFWIAGKLSPQHCRVAIAVGALFDFLSGAVPRAPEAMRRLRLEWLFRLWIEPGRLWRRYIVGNPLFLARVLRQKLGHGGPA